MEARVELSSGNRLSGEPLDQTGTFPLACITAVEFPRPSFPPYPLVLRDRPAEPD